MTHFSSNEGPEASAAAFKVLPRPQQSTGLSQAARQELLPLLSDLPLLPCGAGRDHKAPIDPGTGRALKGWQSASYTPQQIAAMNGVVRAVGTRCGPDAGGLLVLDIDGTTACLHLLDHCGIDPHTANTWAIERTTDRNRLKLAYRIPKDLQPLLTKGRAKLETGPDEQLEIYWRTGQVIALGEHVKSGGHYTWRGNPADTRTLDTRHRLWPLVMELLGGTKQAATSSTQPRRQPQQHTDLPPRPMEAVFDALQKVPTFDHDQGRRDELLALCQRLHVELGRDQAQELMQAHSPAVGDMAGYFTTEPNRISAGSLWPFLREHYGVDIKRHDLKGKRPRRQAAAKAAEGSPSPAEQREGGLPGLLSAIPSGWVMVGDGEFRKTPVDAGDLAGIVRRESPGLTRFNDLTRRIEFAGEAIEEDRAAVFYTKLQTHGYKVTSQHTTDAVLDVAYDSRYHPVREYLDAVVGAGDVAPVDLSKLATTYLGTADPLADSMLRKALIGAVARVCDPGCQFDSVCVLRGKQGIRKSSFWKVLASPGWFNCTAPDSDKDLILNIHSCWLFELAELENITGKREVGQLRNLITTSTDLIRVPYGKTTAPYPRRSILVGSVNGDAFLRDDEGSRRFWVIECQHDFDRGELIDVDQVCRDRDAIWKAAVLAYRSGERPYLDHAEQVDSNRRNARYEQEHPWTAQLDAWVRRQGAEPFTTAEALTGSGCRERGQVGKREEMEACTVLRKLGLQREANPSRTGSGGRARRWHNLAQPGTTSSGEVVPGETPVVLSDLSTPAQPAQPFLEKVQEVGDGGTGGERAGKELQPPPFEVVPVVPPPKTRCAATGLPRHNLTVQRLCRGTPSLEKSVRSDTVSPLNAGDPPPLRFQPGDTVAVRQPDGSEPAGTVRDLPLQPGGSYCVRLLPDGPDRMVPESDLSPWSF